ncbi:MAG: UPF0721 transmembrane protein [Rhodothalassiaceae bacterium]|nr:MAG: UPF0721 transmembrane protein [Rhodothalassiaceae bacterium]
MSLYFPIAEVAFNIYLIVAIGALVGLLSGMFGVGGGFLITPLLMFLGVPAPVAVATGANLITASSVSGALAHARRGGIDMKMGAILTIGGGAGAVAGAWLFGVLKRLGQLDVVIASTYALLLGTVGALMLLESLAALRRQHGHPDGTRPPPRRRHVGLRYALPFRMRFRASRLYISALLPLGVGFVVGVLAAVMGVGGGFLMIPAMIYIIGMPASVVVGTSLFQIVFVTAFATMLHATQTQSVDIMLSAVLVIGAVAGAQYGARLASRVAGVEFRVLLALMVLLVALRMAWSLFVAPETLYRIEWGLG